MTMGEERRRWPRQTYAGGRLPPSARVRHSAVVTLVDLSGGGALVEGCLRLRWGSRCEVEWTAADGVVGVAARVVRCFVARLDASAVRYRTALSFEVPVAQPAEEDLLAEYQVPGGIAAISAGGVVTARWPGRARPPSAGQPKFVAREKGLTWHRP